MALLSYRAGLTRALVLRFRVQVFKLHKASESVRKHEYKALETNLKNLYRGEYLIVTGDEGVGKTHLIHAIAEKQHGVIKISVSTLTCSLNEVMHTSNLMQLPSFRLLNLEIVMIRLWMRLCEA
jgi:ABC-type uncharacterized transport system fused permease/ATPase subunit